MVVPSTRWLMLSYFNYFIVFGVFLPFWGVWLRDEGLSAEAIGILLGAGLLARFLGNLLLTSLVTDPASLVTALRLLALLSLLCSVGFLFSSTFAWVLLVIIGFNLFFGPITPLTDALAATWQRQLSLDYGRVRVWGSLAFVAGSVITGELVASWGHRVILYSLILTLLVTLLGMLLRPDVMPQGRGGAKKQPLYAGLQLLRIKPVRRFLLCSMLLQSAHAAYYSFSAIYWQQVGYSAAAIGYFWSLGVVAEVIVFTFSRKLFRGWTVRGLLALAALSSVVRWALMGATTEPGGLIVAQLLHCGTFAVGHLAAMRFIFAQAEPEIIRLQALYSSLVTGGLALTSMLLGYLFERYQEQVFWIMALMVLPVFLLRPTEEKAVR